MIFSIGLDESIKLHTEELAKENGLKNVTWVQTGGVISATAGPVPSGLPGWKPSLNSLALFE